MPRDSAAEASVWAIVLAGGVGRRFGPRPKQFAVAGGTRLVDWTVAAARRTCDAVALVLPPDHVWDGAPVQRCAVGGEHQADSVRAGLAVVPRSAEIVVLADAAHPLAPDELFAAVVGAVRAGADGAVPVLPAVDVVALVDDGRLVRVLPRDGLGLVQLPQAFRASALRTAHAGLPRPVENSGLLVDLGYRVEAVPGDPGNLHVTTRTELAIVDRIAASRRPHPTTKGTAR